MKLSNLDEVRDLARRLRGDLGLEAHRVAAPHVGSNLSIYAILATLYARILRYAATNPTLPARDRFILRKGHACL